MLIRTIHHRCGHAKQINTAGMDRERIERLLDRVRSTDCQTCQQTPHPDRWYDGMYPVR